MMRTSLLHLARSTARHLGVELSRARPNSSLLPLHLHELFKQRDINVVLDVGARHGEFGVFLRSNGYRGRIISFEPVASNYAILAKASAQDPMWTSMRLALGAEDRAADINVTHMSYFSSFFSPNDYSLATFGDAPSVTSIESVRVKRLDALFDDLLAENPDPHVYLKMDTQGFDLEVLKGATDCVDRIVGMQSEVAVCKIYDGSPSMLESIDSILGYGFKIRGFPSWYSWKRVTTRCCGPASPEPRNPLPASNQEYLSGNPLFKISGMFPVNLDDGLRVIEFDCVAVR